MKKKLYTFIGVIGIVATSSCAQSSNNTEIQYEKYDSSTIKFTDDSNANDNKFRNDLYFRNDLNQDMGDPMMVYDNDTFYAYGTYNASIIATFTSKDLTNWTRSKTNAFTPAPGSWSTRDIWAPDLQKIGDKWYLYYTANYSADGKSNCQIGVAIGDSPAGPFTQFTGTNANGENITLDKPAFFYEGHTILDQHVFQDDNGELYMFFSYDTNTSTPEEGHDKGCAEIWGVKMKDPVTWDFSTLTRLISPGYKKLSDSSRTIDWETWSPSFQGDMECVEGPYMIKKNGKYILTYVANSFVDTEYAVGYAVSDSPLGIYDKPNSRPLENMILGVPGQTGTYINTRYLGFQTGTGHASICKVGDELMFAYHAHLNRDKWGAKEDEYGEKSKWRALAVDYLHFDENGIPYANGPTWSLQKLPDVVTKTENLALKATFKADGKNLEYFNDKYTNRAIKTEEVAKEVEFEAGKHAIEIKLDKPHKIKAVNVFNSYDYTKKIDYINQIDFGNSKGVVDLLFNTRYVNNKTKFVFPHSAFNVALDEEVVTDRIVIEVESKTPFAIGEIEVIGE